MKAISIFLLVGMLMLTGCAALETGSEIFKDILGVGMSDPVVNGESGDMGWQDWLVRIGQIAMGIIIPVGAGMSMRNSSSGKLFGPIVNS